MGIALCGDDDCTSRHFTSVSSNDVDVWSSKETLIVDSTRIKVLLTVKTTSSYFVAQHSLFSL